MLKGKFNKLYRDYLFEAVDDFFDDGTYIWINNGAREFSYFKDYGIMVENVGNIGATHAAGFVAIQGLKQNKLKLNDDNTVDAIVMGDELKFKIHGDYNKIPDLNDVDRASIIGGRFWDKRSPKIRDKKPFGFWVYDDKYEATDEGINQFIHENSNHIMKIQKMLGVDFRLYMFQFQSIESKKGFNRSYEDVLKIIEGNYRSVANEG